MNNDPTSLDNLHDIALPAEVSWWPLAPGWYFVFAILFLLVFQLVWRVWQGWNANAYRREAVKQLAKTEDPAVVAEILRRVALAILPRAEVAELSGEAWARWLSETCSTPMPAEVREQLVSGLYSSSQQPAEETAMLEKLKGYAQHWIVEHNIASIDAAV